MYLFDDALQDNTIETLQEFTYSNNTPNINIITNQIRKLQKT
jgi:hypothetical protein